MHIYIANEHHYVGGKRINCGRKSSSSVSTKDEGCALHLLCVSKNLLITSAEEKESEGNGCEMLKGNSQKASFSDDAYPQ